MLHAELQGEVVLQALQDPWPLQARLSTSAIGVGADSPLCANRYVSRLPVNSGAKSKNAKDKDSAGKEDDADCTLDIETTLAGTLDDLKQEGKRSEERRVGKEGGGKCRTRW